ncbi:DUF255 domain-containing protein [Zavarzinia aquatilis]|nr:DUF255 domain-containing protein [Zavarzinia aquatilis]
MSLPLIRARLFLLALFILAPLSARAEVAWRDWSPAAFDAARAESKLVLLDLEAVWCHWCHVMDETTYADPAVQDLLAQRFVAVKVDQDSHPDLSRRYENWGWPALIVFDAEGRELWRWRGYLEPVAFVGTLAGLADSPQPLAESGFRALPPGAAEGGLPRALLASMERRFAFAYDAGVGGWGGPHKFLQADALDHALSAAVDGDVIAGRMARETLTAALALVDPVEGGIFQYAVGAWNAPHYEKIAGSQAAALRLFAAGAAWTGDKAYADAARAVARYASTVLSDPAGGFFTSQDADPDVAAGMTGKDYYGLDAKGRAAMAPPRIDRNVYASETGLIAAGLAEAGADLDDESLIGRAKAAGHWLIAARRQGDGSFAHGERDAGGPFLPDTLNAGLAFEALYAATGERVWLAAATDAAAALLRHFADPAGGLANAEVTLVAAGPVGRPFFHLDDNVTAARLLLRLHHQTGDAALGAAARRIFAFLQHQEAASPGSFWPGLLVLDGEAAAEPLHVVVTGRRGESAALFAAARALPRPWKRVELYDAAEGPLPNIAVTLPDLGRPAAFICTATTCSLPVFEPAEIAQTVERLSQPTN